MGRVLTAAQARVAPTDRGPYLALLADLARRRAARGQHLWLFEQRGTAGAFLEFREGPADALPGDADELALEARLVALADYAAGAEVPWDEVPLSPRPQE
jgi:hypothetical protein